MIGALQGEIIRIGSEGLLINVQGVGYEVYAVPRLLDRLQLGSHTLLSIETMVREDFIRLYGFENEAERHCFRLLQSVQGVGAKAALAILQVLPPNQLLDAISMEDTTSIAQAQGVGKKIATRITTELAGKMPDMSVVRSLQPQGTESLNPATTNDKESAIAATENTQIAARAERLDAISALVNLGYDPGLARQAVSKIVAATPDAALQEIIKGALRQLTTI